MNLGGFISNESTFGRLMTKCGTIIVLNVLFALSCIPFITIGPAMTALYYAVFEMRREEVSDRLENTGGTINPFAVFWRGFRENFFRSLLCWAALVGILMLGTVNLQICSQAGGLMKSLSSVIIAVMIIVYVTGIFLFPVLSRKKGNLKEMVLIALRTAVMYPARTIPVLILYTVPLALIRLDEVNSPAYAFIFCFFGCALIARICAGLVEPCMEVQNFAAGRQEGACSSGMQQPESLRGGKISGVGCIESGQMPDVRDMGDEKWLI